MNKQEVETKAHEYATIAFGNPKTMFPSQIIQYNNGHEGFVRGALWMQQNQSGMRWVLATPTNLPELHKEVLVRTNAAKKLAEPETYLGYLDEDLVTLEKFFVLINFHHPDFDVYDLDLIEWLDSSPSPDIERIRQEHKEMYAKLQQVQALIEVKGCYDLLEPINSLIQKIEANGTTDR